MTGRNGGAALIALAVATALRPGGAMAQDAGPAASPSWRVGRLAALSGSVATHGPNQTDWVAAVLNAPLQAGDAVWTAAGGAAAVQVQQDELALDQGTELDIATLDGQTLGVVEPQGRLFLDLYDVPAGQTATVTTPRGAVKLQVPGRYEITAGDSSDPTRIAVVTGSATITSGSFTLTVSANEMAEITGDQALNGHVDPLAPDPFLTEQLRRLQPPAPGTPQAVCAMTGGAALAGYGQWHTQPQYGAVWFPQVASGWVPYREGRWSYVQPWGWTWVDDEPWGFAPFHYGRWSQFDGRWGWIPVEQDAPPIAYAQPAYAPALVDFVAAGAVAGAVAGALVGGLLAAGNAPIGWVPLGPQEPYRPPFAVGTPYLQRLTFNRFDQDNRRITVNNINTVNNITNINQFSNHQAFTAMPAAAMARSEAVPRSGFPGPEQFRDARAFSGPNRLPPPDAIHAGRGFAPPPGSAFARPAPGPAVNQALFRPHALPLDRTPFRNNPGPTPVMDRGPEHAGGPGLPPFAHPTAGPIHAIVPPPGPGAAHPPIAQGLPTLRDAHGVPAGAPPGVQRFEAARPDGRPGEGPNHGPARPNEPFGDHGARIDRATPPHPGAPDRDPGPQRTAPDRQPEFHHDGGPGYAPPRPMHQPRPEPRPAPQQSFRAEPRPAAPERAFRPEAPRPQFNRPDMARPMEPHPNGGFHPPAPHPQPRPEPRPEPHREGDHRPPG